MKKTFTKKKSAFSLIELSIVLIIIGLLIAGITGGASLIKSSELRSVMGEARGYAVAVNAFFTQYGSLPGDYNKAVGSEATYIGNADGKIEFARDFDSIPGSEGTLAWHMLVATGAITDTLTAVAANAINTPGTNLPRSKIKSAGWAFGYDTTSLQNVVVLTGATTAATANGDLLTSALSKPALIGSDALSIDSKIDDGVGNTGKVRGHSKADVDADGTEESCQTGGTYETSSSSVKVCAVSYQVDVNS